MRSFFVRWCGAAVVVGLGWLELRAPLAADAASEHRGGDAAAQLVCEALEAEAQGETSARAELLRRALEIMPDYSPARWQSGEVRVADRWLSVEMASQEAARAGHVDAYRKLRDRVRASAKDHQSLAAWCAKHGLPDQERLHLLFALQLAPKSHDIIEKLRLTRQHGALVSREQAETLDRHSKQLAVTLATWKPRLSKLRRDIESDITAKRSEARQKLQSIDDPLLVPAIEAIFADSTAEAGEAVIAALAHMPDQVATDSLARHAVFSPRLDVRKAAARALASRSMFSYVPTMIFALESPVDVRYDTYYLNGQILHRLALFRQGLLTDQSFVSTGGTSHEIVISRRYGNSVQINPDKTALPDALLAEQESQANVAREELNGRIAAALQTATGNNLQADPEQWRYWWFDYNEMYRPPIKPLSQTVRYYVPPPTQIRYMSCFVAGTKVWTSTGPMPIEQIRIGEWVLAQNPETGELAYKPVVGTTERPPSPLIELFAGGQTVRTTRGHPFWISGIGWQMAKELKAGQWLHTPHGPLLIESIGQAEPATCHNLIVADFGTYFITDQQVLVHDNNLRQVTTATVPGLVHP
jgi:hypothetical protein